MNKKRRLRCDSHKANGRSWNHYFQSHTYEGTDYYRCKECAEAARIFLLELEKRNAIELENKKEKWRLEDEEREKRGEALAARQQDELWDFIVRKELMKGITLKGELRWKYRT